MSDPITNCGSGCLGEGLPGSLSVRISVREIAQRLTPQEPQGFHATELKEVLHD
jgi:hypothetical protein